MSMTTEVFIRYLVDDIDKIKLDEKSDWIDLRAAETVEMKQGEWKLIPLGVTIKLPDGFEAYLAPRSSTFKNYGILVANSIGIIDNSYCGVNDQWMLSVYATRDTVINKNDRICQFRVQQKQPVITLSEIDSEESWINLAGSDDRGGFGSTGRT